MHNFDHGKRHLSHNMYLLTLLAFFYHQIFELSDPAYQLCRHSLVSKKDLWERFRLLIEYFIVDSWYDLMLKLMSNRGGHPTSFKKLVCLFARHYALDCVEFDPATFVFDTDEGFAAAGIYLKQFKVAYQSTTYLVRTRSEVTGTEAGNKFTTAGIAYINTFSTSTAKYEVNGVASTHDTLWSDFINGFSLTDNTLPEATVSIKNAGDSTIWNAETVRTY